MSQHTYVDELLHIIAPAQPGHIAKADWGEAARSASFKVQQMTSWRAGFGGILLLLIWPCMTYTCHVHFCLLASGSLRNHSAPLTPAKNVLTVRAWCAGAGQPARAAAAAGRRRAPAAAPRLLPPKTLSRTGGAQRRGCPRARHACAVYGARLRGRGGRRRRPARRGRLCAGAAAALAAGRRGRAPGRSGVPALLEGCCMPRVCQKLQVGERGLS